MKKCRYCNKEIYFSIVDGRTSRTTLDGMLRIKITYNCPYCKHKNKILNFISYEPNREDIKCI